MGPPLARDDRTNSATSAGSGPIPEIPPPASSPGSTLSKDYQRDWPAYFDAVRDQPPRDTLLRALAILGPRDPQTPGQRWAIDIACGEGRDTRAILRHDPSWRVVALDASSEGLRRLVAALDPAKRARVVMVERTLEDLGSLGLPPDVVALPADGVDLINASFALPFCEPRAFPALWAWIGRTLRDGGCFAGQIFGDRDDWAGIRPESHFTRDRALALFAGWRVAWFDEVEKDGRDAMGGTKHHHLFHIVAQRTPEAPGRD